MQKNKSHRGLLLLILLPPILAACLCVALLTPRVVNFFNSSDYPDYLWSLRVTRELNAQGCSVHDVSVSDSVPPGFRTIEVQVGNLIEDEQQRTFDVVKTVHSVVMNTFENSSPQPEPVDVISIIVFDYSSGIYFISTDFEIVDKFMSGEISEETYFENWSYSDNTKEIAPP